MHFNYFFKTDITDIDIALVINYAHSKTDITDIDIALIINYAH